MSEFFDLIQSLDLFELFNKIQNDIFYINEIRKFDLEIPQCVKNKISILKFYMSEKWLDDFPEQSLILKFIQDEKELFYLPESADFYYLYYHLLRATKNYLEKGKKIYNEYTSINYYKLNLELIEKKLNATKFFEIYFEKGSNFTEEDLISVRKTKDELNDEEFNFNSKEMISGEPEPLKELISESELIKEEKTESDEIELEPKTKEISQIEIEVEEVNLDDEVTFKSFV